MGTIVFCSKKVVFGGSYPGYVITGLYGVGACFNGTRFIGMNWLGTMGTPTRYVGIVVTACAGSIIPPPLGLACFVNMIAFAKKKNLEEVFLERSW